MSYTLVLSVPSYENAGPQSKTSVIHLQVGVVRLINKNVVEACFPLHEGRHDINGPQGEKSDRRVSFNSLPDRV